MSNDDTYKSNQEIYSSMKEEYLALAESMATRLDRLKIKFSALSGYDDLTNLNSDNFQELLDYIELRKWCKYKSQDRFLSINLTQVDEIFTEIERNENVMFFNKVKALELIDNYFDYLITIDTLTIILPAKRKRKESNELSVLLGKLLDSESIIRTQKDTFTKLAFKSLFNSFPQKFTELIQLINSSVAEDAVQKLMEGNVVLARQIYLPQFHSLFHLRKKNLSQTRSLIFELTPIIFPAIEHRKLADYTAAERNDFVKIYFPQSKQYF